MNRTGAWGLAAVLLMAAPMDSFGQEVKASPGQTLDLQLVTGATVHIVGWDEPSVKVDAVKKGRDADMVRVEVRRTARGVEVLSEYTTKRESRSSRIEIDIKVPRRFDVEIDSMGGEVRIEDVEGTMRGRTMGGDLTLTRLRGRLELSTMGGAIQLTASRVDGTVSTMGGNVTLEDVTGNVRGSSMGGNVVTRNVKRSSTAAASPSSAKEVQISTMGGEISIADAMAGANVSTMGGNIRILQAARHVKASTMGGDVRLDAVDGWIEATTMGGNVMATMVGDADRGDRHVKLTSMSGDITLTVPPSLGMRFDIKVAYTRNSRQDYKILGDFPVQIRSTTEWDYSKGSPRRFIYGTGTAGSGKHVIEIETVNGDVTIRKRAQ